ncbi:MAG: hypothetical protein CSB49_03650 [Proteobacteria bacterium]|nr:MAG: hypothetical protein CSB49_03650 [Pseudomonadota bacterium]
MSAWPTASAPREALLEAGCRVDHYRVVRLLGRGGFGDVYLARDTRLGRRVALKVVHPEHLGSDEAIERFLFEARATARFAHPHIVTVFGVGEHEGMPYVALEYLEGRTLRQLLRDEPPSQAEALRVALAIAEALTEAHGANILHRDLKPENVFLPRDGRLRVLDFGLAKKLGHASPERARATEVAEAIAPTELMRPPTFDVDAHSDTLTVTPLTESGASESGTSESGTSESGTSEAGTSESGTSEAGTSESGTSESGTSEAGTSEAGETFSPFDQQSARPLPIRASRAHVDGDHSDTVEYATLLTGYDSSAQSSVRGTPFYMSPEQWSGGEQGSAVDIWALGVLLHELLCGRFPFRATQPLAVGYEVCSAQPLKLHLEEKTTSPELIGLVSRCLSKDPRHRPTAPAVAAELRTLLSPGQQQLAEEQGPFRGLLPFGERHAGLYFGREAELAAFLEQLRDEPTLAVVGPSGAGKSSFVAAGVVPRMREQGPLVLLRVRPGGDPFAALATRLRAGEQLSTQLSQRAGEPEPGVGAKRRGDTGALESAKDAVAELAGELAETPSRLGLELRQLAERLGARVLLFVDQLEELYTQVEDPELRRRFTSALHNAADDPHDPVRVVITLRDDFLGRVAEGQDARRLLSRVTVLRSPDRAALRAILSRSADAFGFRYEDDAIVDEMIAAIDDEPACLPLLSFAGRMLWERRDRENKLLRRADYEAMGGVAGALASHADAVLQALSIAQINVARQLLLRLITADGTRRSVERSKLLEGLGDEAAQVLARLTEARLLTSGRRGDGDTKLELAHERLIDSWGRLSRWIDESRDERVFLAEIGQAAELWERRGERDAEVWQGEALEEARRGLDRCVSVPQQVERFVAAGEAYEAEQQRAATRRRRMIRGGLIGGAVVIIGMTIAWGLVARKQAIKVAVARDDARRQLVRAHAEAATLALSQKEPHKARALLRTALEQGLRRGRLPRSVLRQLRLVAFENRHRPLRLRLRLQVRPLTLALAPDGRTLWLSEVKGKVLIYDTATGRGRHTLAQSRGVHALAYDPRGRFVAAAVRRAEKVGEGSKRRWTNHYELLLLRPADGQLLRRHHLSKPVELLQAVAGHVYFTSSDALWEVDPIGAPKRLQALEKARALSREGGSLRAIVGSLRDIDTVEGTKRRPWPTLPKHWGYGIATFVQGTAVTTRDRSFPCGRLLFDPTGAAVERAAPAKISTLVGSPTHDLVAAGLTDGHLQLWSARARALRATLRVGDQRVLRVAWSADGQTFAAVSGNAVGVWRVAPTLQRAARGHTGMITAVAITPDGRFSASSGWYRTLLWENEPARQVLQLAPKRMNALDFSPDGRRLVGAGQDGLVHIWELPTGRKRRGLRGHSNAIVDVQYDPRGGRFATTARDRTVRLWSAEGRLLKTFELKGGPTAISFHPTKPLLKVATFDGPYLIQSIDLDTGRVTGARPREGRRIRSKLKALRYDRQGRLLLIDNDNVLRVDGIRAFARPNMQLFDGPLPGDRWGHFLYSYRFSRIEGLNEVALHRRPGRRITHRLGRHQGSIMGIAVDRRGRHAITADTSSGLRFWRLGRRTPRGHVIAFIPPRIYTRQGIRKLQPSPLVSAVVEQPTKAWERAVVGRAIEAARSEDGSTLCLRDREGSYELWDIASDRRLVQRSYSVGRTRWARAEGIVTPVFVGAFPRACVFFISNQLYLERPGKPTTIIADDQMSVSFGKDILALDVKQRLTRYAPDGRRLRRYPVVKAGRVIDYDDRGVFISAGSVVVRPWDSDDPSRIHRVPMTRGHPVAALRGPRELAFIGTKRGHLQVWDLERRRQVIDFELVGGVMHLALRGRLLYAVSELGDAQVVDLSPLLQPPCELLRDVWRRQPAIWDDGKLKRRGAPAQHRCLAPAEGSK